MLRAIVLLLAAAPLVSAAPVPKTAAEKDALYFPTKVGTKRVMELTAGDTKTESTQEVTKVEEKDGVFRVTLGRPGNTSTLTPVYAVSSKGVSIVARGQQELADPQPLLKLPAKADDTWEVTPVGPGGQAVRTKTVYTVGKAEEVEVPAGKFKAVPVTSAIKSPTGETVSTATTWFAPGVGIVKTATKFGDTERSSVLKSFTPGK